ncbi:MAG: zf-HC2 domain-containing protein [Desulfotomaculaceae bacterium]|nr:zf-HC2 domain-containing protein [Desulfotomaculaceae bacterium]
MRCYDAGTLQAFLDGEVYEADRKQLEEHLLACDECSSIVERLRDNQTFANAKLTGYSHSLTSASVDTGLAWNRFSSGKLKDRTASHRRKGVLNMFARYRSAAVAAVFVLAIATSFSFGSVRSAASELLSIFRVEQVKTVSITPEDMANIERSIREGAGQVDIEHIGQFEFSGKAETSRVTQAEAAAALDFQLRLPAVLPEGFQVQEFNKTTGVTMNLTLDTTSTNEILKSLGSSKLLPDELNGKMFAVKIPATVQALYAGANDSRVMMWQGRSPELLAPGSDVAAIRDALLDLPFLPDSLRRQLAAVNDWQHTILVPDVGGSSQEVSVAGQQGVFITSSAGENHHERGNINSLIWQEDGVVYVISGSLNLEQAQQMAASIK